MATKRAAPGEKNRIHPRTGPLVGGLYAFHALGFALPSVTAPVFAGAAMPSHSRYLGDEDRALLALNGDEDDHDAVAHIEDRAHEGRTYSEMDLRLTIA